MPASLETVKIALQAYGNGDCEIALALADPLIRWDERASRPDGDLVWGVGLHPSIVTASLRAVVNAVNRALAQRKALEGALLFD